MSAEPDEDALSAKIKAWWAELDRLNASPADLPEAVFEERVAQHQRLAAQIMRTPSAGLAHLGGKILIVDSFIDWNGLKLADDLVAEARTLCGDPSRSAHRAAPWS